MEKDSKNTPQIKRIKRNCNEISNSGFIPTVEQQEKALRSCCQEETRNLLFSSSYTDLLKTKERAQQIFEKECFLEHPMISAFSSVVLGWLVEVCVEFDFSPSVLLLAAHIFRCYLKDQKDVLVRHTLQCYGIASFVLASKCDINEQQVRSMEISLAKKLCDNAFKQERIIKAEQHLLSILQYNCNLITPAHFFAQFMHEKMTLAPVITLAERLTILVVAHNNYAAFLPSQIAQTALWIVPFVVKNERMPLPFMQCQDFFVSAMAKHVEIPISDTYFEPITYQQVREYFKEHVY